MYVHEKYKNQSDSSENVLVKKYLDELQSKPDLINNGEKEGSGSET